MQASPAPFFDLLYILYKIYISWLYTYIYTDILWSNDAHGVQILYLKHSLICAIKDVYYKHVKNYKNPAKYIAEQLSKLNCNSVNFTIQPKLMIRSIIDLEFSLMDLLLRRICESSDFLFLHNDNMTHVVHCDVY